MKARSIALLAGMVACAFARQAPGSESANYQETVLYSFSGARADGAIPLASLIDVNGTLYGTTSWGGYDGNVGIVFALDPDTTAETVLHSFCIDYPSCTDSDQPQAGLIDVNGVLYGTTERGGATGCAGSGCGTVFSLDPGTGTETVLYSFCSQANCTDGSEPYVGLIAVNGMLYGTTSGGGVTGCDGFGCGMVFSLDPGTGVEKVLYSFCSRANCADGEYPLAGLIAARGMLYGTTVSGGVKGCDNSGCGTAFSIDPKTGVERVLYSFCSQQNCTDGAGPVAGLINVKGTLYGTTAGGGTGVGTVFSLDPDTGTETVLHSFAGDEGAYPEAGLVDVKGTLYGTTREAGSHGQGGTVFALNLKSGNEQVLYSFCSQAACVDGNGPEAGLIDVKGTLFGTTGGGGANNYPPECVNGCGTVFALTKIH